MKEIKDPKVIEGIYLGLLEVKTKLKNGASKVQVIQWINGIFKQMYKKEDNKNNK